MWAARAYRYLGGDPVRIGLSLKDYDAAIYGPFLGVSDEGSAAEAIRHAAYASPKVQALARSKVSALQVGVAIDAERLGAIGEIPVGPEEYLNIWLECVGRLLVTTNVGTRVNLRFYRRAPRILVIRDSRRAIAEAEASIASAFKPFVETPDGRPRPLTVYIDIPRYSTLTTARRLVVLRKMVRFVRLGRAVGRGRAPKGQDLGLVAWVGRGLKGKTTA